MNDIRRAALAGADDRKKSLIAQGRLHRLGIIESKLAIEDNLQPAALLRTTLDQLKSGSSAALDNIFSIRTLDGLKQSLGDEGWKTLLPMATGLFSIVSKRAVIKPVLIGSAVLAVGSFVARALVKKRRAKRNAHQANISGEASTDSDSQIPSHIPGEL